MPHKFSPQNIERLLRADRFKDLTVEDALKDAGLKQGMTIADVGCGPRFFTIPASKIVGKNGCVYAIDTQEEMLEELKKRVTEDNVIPIKSEENSIPIPDGAIDFSLLAFVLHEVDDKPLFLKEVRRILKTNSIVLLIDWEKKVESEGPPFEDRLSFGESSALLEDAGLKIKTASSLNPSHYRIAAEKK